MSRIKELRPLTEGELRERVVQVRQDLYGLRVKAAHRPIEQPHRIRQMKRDIARMLTLLRERLTPPAESPRSS